MRHSALEYMGSQPVEGRPYRTLLVALEYHPGRWSDPTIAAAGAIPDAGHLSAQDWTAVLDDLERAMASVLSAYRPSSVRLRTALVTSN